MSKTKYIKYLILPILITSLAACDESDSSNPDNGLNPEDQIEQDIDDNTDTDPDQTDNGSGSEQEDSGLYITYPSVGISASLEQSEEGNTADKAIDEDSSTVWSGESGTVGGDVWLDLDLGELQTVNTIKLDFKKTLERNFCFSIYTSTDGNSWDLQRNNITSYGNIFYSITESDIQYVRYEGYGNSKTGWNSITEIAAMKGTLTGDEDVSDGIAGTCVHDLSTNEANYAADNSILQLMDSPLVSGSGATFNGGAGLDTEVDPGTNFDLSTWKITYPNATEIQPPAAIDNEFYTDPATGAMVFQCPNVGSTTSSGTKYSRTELREMLNSNAGTTELGNNWVISTASATNQADAGGVDGNMKATISVDQVSTSTDVGSEYMIGRVIVGQIHASDDEPFKIYYRLLPGHTKGFVYFAYEDSEKETFYPMLGDTTFDLYGSDVNAAEPSDGIALGEKWSYEVDVVGRDMTVTVTKADGTWVARTITWSSEYDSDWFYFKAGAYNQNNGGEAGQNATVSFYAFDVQHD